VLAQMILDHLVELLQLTTLELLFVQLSQEELPVWDTIALQITLDSINAFQMLGLL